MLKSIKTNVSKWATDQKNNYKERRGSKKLTMCKRCHTYYYKNSWHFYEPDGVEIDYNEEIPVKFTECNACLEEQAAIFEADPSFA